MDLGLAGRVVVVATDDPVVGAACTRALKDEGAAVRYADLAEGAAAVAEALGQHGRVDAVVACHALHRGRQVVDVAAVEELYGAWDAVQHTVAAYRAALPPMTAAGWGRLVAVVSSGVKWLQDGADDLDAVAGLGLLGMHKAAVADVAAQGIAVNAVLRGPDDVPDDVAAVVAFLCSDRAGYLHGVTMALDGARSPAVF